ncbi:hypothetical protein [Psychroserpens burtonensis]|uniref:hypothetical protein n=1 Tax=Psychroserpens burtonensis TaxID=49278 RepID=UPI0004234615|nr:hypothetical protein [Psychroserpens burtonensis]
MEKAAKHANRMLLMNRTLNELKAMVKDDSEMTVVLIKVVLDNTRPVKEGFLTINLK